MKKLIIFGNSIFAEVAYFYFKKFSDYDVIFLHLKKIYKDEKNVWYKNIDFGRTIKN